MLHKLYCGLQYSGSNLALHCFEPPDRQILHETSVRKSCSCKFIVDFYPQIANSNDLVLISSPDVLFETITSIPGDLEPAFVSPSQSSLQVCIRCILRQYWSRQYVTCWGNNPRIGVCVVDAFISLVSWDHPPSPQLHWLGHNLAGLHVLDRHWSKRTLH